MPTTLEIANQLVSLCREGRFAECASLYSPDAVSIEAFAPPGMSAEVKGLAAIEAKGAEWMANNEVHSLTVTGPWPNGDRFIVGFSMDVTMKQLGQRMKMDEAALYTVKDGKIVREEFFYSAG